MRWRVCLYKDSGFDFRVVGCLPWVKSGPWVCVFVCPLCAISRPHFLSSTALNKTRHPPKKSECLQSRKVGPPPSDARYSQLSVP